MLLTYDAYGAHMSLAVLLLLRESRMVVYALPVHTSGKTQPLDAVLFSALKKELNATIASIVLTGVHTHVDMYLYCSMLATAYPKSFTHQNICPRLSVPACGQ